MGDSLVLQGERERLRVGEWPAGLRPEPNSELSSGTDSEPEIRTQPASEPTRSRPARVEGYDWIRLLAAINVVIFHVASTPSGLIGRGGVPAFLMIAGSIPAMRLEIEPFGRFLRHRARRILIPWLFWSGLYAAVAGARYWRHGIVPEWSIHSLFVGTAIHLWFFPAAFVGGLLIWPLLRFVNSLSAAAAFTTVGALAAALFATHAWLSNAWSLIAPYGQWLFGAPALAVGVALGLACRERLASRRRLLIALAGLVAIVAVGLYVMIGDGPSGISYLFAGTIVPSALLLPIRSNAVLRQFTQVALGVYASHPLVHLGLQSVMSPRWAPVWFMALAVFLGAVAISALLRKAPWGKAIV
jgi:surface polysaccharide O-acyltransferase-like enzyme